MTALFSQLGAIADEGGWVFWCLVALAFGIAFALLSIWHFLQFPNAPLLQPAEWQRLLGHRDREPGLLGELDARLGEGAREGQLAEIGGRMFAVLERRIPFAFVLIGVAPLVGLLGTVAGMFTTFDGLAGATGLRPVDVISKGVSEALITTQAGLVISVPSFIVCCVLKGRFDHLRNGFDRVEASLATNRRQHG